MSKRTLMQKKKLKMDNSEKERSENTDTGKVSLKKVKYEQDMSTK